MARNGRFTFLLLISLLTIASCASAFDGKRSGFCLGFGAGLETINAHQQGTAANKTRMGFQTTFDIGAGVSDQILILYSGHTTINIAEDPPYDKLVWLEPSIVLRYYFKPTLRSFYVFGGPALAFGTGATRFAGEFGAGGIGGAIGGGYQFSRNFQVELGAILTTGGESNPSFTTIHATLNVMGN